MDKRFYKLQIISFSEFETSASGNCIIASHKCVNIKGKNVNKSTTFTLKICQLM